MDIQKQKQKKLLQRERGCLDTETFSTINLLWYIARAAGIQSYIINHLQEAAILLTYFLEDENEYRPY